MFTRCLHDISENYINPFITKISGRSVSIRIFLLYRDIGLPAGTADLPVPAVFFQSDVSVQLELIGIVWNCGILSAVQSGNSGLNSSPRMGILPHKNYCDVICVRIFPNKPVFDQIVTVLGIPYRTGNIGKVCSLPEETCRYRPYHDST